MSLAEKPLRSASAQRGRSTNLDVLRASAILMVLLFHGTQQSPIDAPWLRAITSYGQCGVDLFFVLSGWLIGGLYWRERVEFGNVQIWRFWVRRWLRTIPPHLAALLVSYVAVRIARGEPFDYGYLLFLQNYYQNIPFFQVSWSLCVEEHFYLIIPVAFLFWRGLHDYRITVACLGVLLVAAPVLRFIEYRGDEEGFGFALTATHLRMDGLILGFLLSYIATKAPDQFKTIVSKAPFVLVGCILLLPPLSMSSGRLYYSLWGTEIALLFSAILLLAVSRNELSGGFAILLRPVALVSYSMYLTHPWALHAARLASSKIAYGPAVYFGLALVLVAATATAFYFVIERAAIVIRDLHWPRRAPQPSKPFDGIEMRPLEQLLP